jgi:sulfonate transport system ATP-binding protein
MNQLLLGYPAAALLDRVAAPPDMPSQPPGVALTLDRLSKSFGTTPVLTDIELTLEPGTFLAIVGQSGSGKSTLLRLIAGLDRPSSGSVVLDGRALRGRNREARLMFQEARLLPWRRALENVLIGAPPGTGGETAEAALAQIGLAARASAWPAELSGGQRQRVALARALIARPRLLLLDEPLGALDALTRLDMQDLIERVWFGRGFTALLVTHDVAEAVRLADRIIVLERGRVAASWNVALPRPRLAAEAAALETEILARLRRRTD